jgi:hypothetical protein
MTYECTYILFDIYFKGLYPRLSPDWSYNTPSLVLLVRVPEFFDMENFEDSINNTVVADEVPPTVPPAPPTQRSNKQSSVRKCTH